MGLGFGLVFGFGLGFGLGFGCVAGATGVSGAAQASVARHPGSAGFEPQRHIHADSPAHAA